MNGLDTDSEATGRRDSIEAAVASHSAGPDVEFAVSRAVEDRDRSLRERPRDETRFDGERKASESRRAAAIAALHEGKLKAAQGPVPAKADVTVKPGAPATWDLKAKGGWDQLPQEARLAAKRDEAGVARMVADVQPHMQQYAEIDKVLAPARQIYQQHGLNDAQAVGKLFEWEGRFRNPQTRDQAFRQLAREYGVDLVPAGQQQQYAQQGYDPSHQQQHDAETQSAISKVQALPHFEKVRVAMGNLIQAGGEDKYRNPDRTWNLALAYHEAVQHLGLGQAQSAPRRPSSPRSRAAPAAGHSVSEDRGGSVKASIMSAIREVRGR